jgi:hypothetical protein
MNRKSFVLWILILLVLTNIITLRRLTNIKSDLASKEKIIKEMNNESQISGKQGTYIIIYKTENLGVPKRGWEDHFENYPNQSEKYIGKSMNEIRELFGEPYLIIKNTDISREFWCYMPNATGENLDDIDNTGIRWYFENNKVVDVRIDDFNGIIEEQVELYLQW